MLPVFLLVTALIVYGSLYPWQFHPATIPGNPLLILLGSWSFSYDRYFLRDTIVNIVLYLPFGAFGFLWLVRAQKRLSAFLPILLALVLSSSIEMIQLFDARRVCSMMDVLTNVTGAALGLAAATRFRAMVILRPGAGTPIFLLCCWTGALLFPFMPDLSTHHLRYKLSLFTSPPFSPLACFNLAVMWMSAARLMEAASTRFAVPLLLLVLPARFLVLDLTLSWIDCLPAAIGLALWLALPRRVTDLSMAAVSLAAILLAGLSPFHLSPSPQEFSWIPFRALFSTDWQSGFVIFFRKSFAYGSTIWLLVSGGLPVLAAALIVAIPLAGLEAIQLWLPNHVSESTDPLHALILAWMFTRMGLRPWNEKTHPATQTQRQASVRL